MVFFIWKTEHQNIQYLQFCLVLAEDEDSEKSLMKLPNLPAPHCPSSPKQLVTCLDLYDDKQKRQNWLSQKSRCLRKWG